MAHINAAKRGDAYIVSVRHSYSPLYGGYGGGYETWEVRLVESVTRDGTIKHNGKPLDATSPRLVIAGGPDKCPDPAALVRDYAAHVAQHGEPKSGQAACDLVRAICAAQRDMLT